MIEKPMAKLLTAEPCSGCPNRTGIESLYAQLTEALDHTRRERDDARAALAVHKTYVEDLGTTLDAALEELEKELARRDYLESQLADARSRGDASELRRRLEEAEAEIAHLWSQLENARLGIRRARSAVAEAATALEGAGGAVEAEPADGRRRVRSGPSTDAIARYNALRPLPRGPSR